jgi:UDP-N-acetylglucosamine/UDP-N-acetylgalactosamine diphosphorylase
MTSVGWNYAHTHRFLEEHDYFGYAAADVTLFAQETLPCLSEEGRILLKDHSENANGGSTSGIGLRRAPAGNGGVYTALQKTGQMQDMRGRGVSSIHCFAIDNAVVKAVDPTFVGYCLSKGADVGNKVVWKEEPGEKVGVFGRICGRNTVIGYSEMPPSIREQRRPDGK